MADEGVDHEHNPTSESTFEGAPSASGLHASPSPTITTLPTSDPAATTSILITTPPMTEGTGLTGMPTYPAYGVDPSTTALPEATTTSEPVASSSAPQWYAADYHHPLPATGAYVDVPGYATLSGLRRGPESCGSRSRGSGRSSNRSLTRSEIKEALRGATSELVGDVTQEIRAKLEPLIPPQASPTILGVSPHRVQANHLVAGLTTPPMSRNCSRVCWCYPHKHNCWGVTLWSGCAIKSRSALSRRVSHLRRPRYGAGGPTSAHYGLTVHHIQGVNNECADYISRNNFDALIGSRSEALATKAFNGMDVHLDLNMTMIRPLDVLQQAEYLKEFGDIYKRLEKRLEPLLVDQ